MRTGLNTSLAVIILVCVSACGGTTAETKRDAPAVLASTPDRGPSNSASDTTESGSSAVSAACGDPAGDGQSLDITAVTLAHTGDQLVVAFVTTAAAPTAGTALWSLLVASAVGDKSAQLGVKFLDGGQIAHFVFDFGTAKQANLQSTVAVTGKTTTASFPYTALDALGAGWTWRAVTNVDGNDVDSCPQEGNDSLNPTKLTFPG